MQEIYGKILVLQRMADSKYKEKRNEILYIISKREFITAIILIIGLILLFRGIHSYYKTS